LSQNQNKDREWKCYEVGGLGETYLEYIKYDIPDKHLLVKTFPLPSYVVKPYIEYKIRNTFGEDAKVEL
jgi:hypothetical protein